MLPRGRGQHLPQRRASGSSAAHLGSQYGPCPLLWQTELISIAGHALASPEQAGLDFACGSHLSYAMRTASTAIRTSTASCRLIQRFCICSAARAHSLVTCQRFKLPARASLSATLAASMLQVLIGRNNRQNDELSHRIAQPQDVWMHARGVPGAHTVLRIPAGRSAPCCEPPASFYAMLSMPSSQPMVLTPQSASCMLMHGELRWLDQTHASVWKAAIGRTWPLFGFRQLHSCT